jgi:4-hydroxy-2-oxoheptanedioate aldolase
MRANAVKRTLQAGKASVGTWLSLANIPAVRFLARMGFDWLTLDMEHSLVDWETATHIFAAAADAGCTPIGRVPANRHDHIKRMLDNGAHGIVVPMVNSREEALAAVAAAKYPPLGTRSVGGSVHVLNFDTDANDYLAHANDEILVVLQCEHRKAVEDADAIFSVPGIDAILVGPNDLAASMRSPDGRPPSGAETTRVMKHIFETCRKYKVPPGIHCGNADEARARLDEGWQFVGVGSELRMMLDGANLVLEKVCGRKKADLAKY